MHFNSIANALHGALLTLGESSQTFSFVPNHTFGLFRQLRAQLCTVFEGMAADVEPLWRARHLQARVVAIETETASVKSFLLQPSVHWQGFAPGQSVSLTFELNGVLHRRYYSLSCSPSFYKRTGLIRLTVKAVEAGLVSQAMHASLKVGNVIGLGAAQGEFTLCSPHEYSGHLTNQHDAPSLFIAAGSGITPIMAMIENLYEQNPDADATLLYCVRNADELIFGDRLKALAEEYAHFRFVPHYSDTEGRVTESDLIQMNQGASRPLVYLCGPGGFRRTVLDHLQSMKWNIEAVRQESFGMRAADTCEPRHPGCEGEVRFERSGLSIRSDGSESLLTLAERAGLRPKYGCRSGICHECSCERGSGELLDLRTGKPIDPSQQRVQACIAAPQGDVVMPAW